MNPTYRRFEDKEHVTGYAKYQPSYPKELYDKTKNVLPAIGRKHASSGQRTFPLTKICKHVIWIDVSREQISKARKAASNIDYRVGQAKDLSFLGDGTIDFMAVATAIHWMDIPICIREVSRVLRPGGVVAVYSFGPDTIHNKEAHQLVWEGFYNKTLGDYWKDTKVHIDNGLAMTEFPFSDTIREEPLLIKREVEIYPYIGLFSSWSSWRRFQEDNPESNALGKLRPRT